jgi:hypothetical protein
VPTNASWANRVEAQFRALRYFTRDGTDHRSPLTRRAELDDPPLHHVAQP